MRFDLRGETPISTSKKFLFLHKSVPDDIRRMWREVQHCQAPGIKNDFSVPTLPRAPLAARAGKQNWANSDLRIIRFRPCLEITSARRCGHYHA